MPNDSITRLIEATGPVVDALIRPAGNQGTVIPLTALLDTGSPVTLVLPSILQPPDFVPIPGGGKIGSGVGVHLARVFATEISLHLPAGKSFPWLPLSIGEQNVSFLGIDFVLGRDFLAHCVFTYNNPRGHFTLSW
jgi:hypothetical protein